MILLAEDILLDFRGLLRGYVNASVPQAVAAAVLAAGPCCFFYCLLDSCLIDYWMEIFLQR